MVAANPRPFLERLKSHAAERHGPHPPVWHTGVSVFLQSRPGHGSSITLTEGIFTGRLIVVTSELIRMTLPSIETDLAVHGINAAQVVAPVLVDLQVGGEGLLLGVFQSAGP